MSTEQFYFLTDFYALYGHFNGNIIHFTNIIRREYRRHIAYYIIYEIRKRNPMDRLL